TAAAFPAAYDTVISVAATTRNDDLASYSNYGDWVDIAAPGSFITSSFVTGKKNVITATGDNNTTYGCISGTSMACPVTAGVVALMYAANPDLMAAQTSEAVDAIREALLGTTDEKEYVYGDHSIKGLVQADKAVAAAKEAKVQVNKKYTLMNAAGTFGAHITGKIARGTKVQLSFGDLKGEKKDKSLKKALKSAKWSSSAPAVLTVKNGKVKCNKKASPGTKVTITAEADGDVMKCDYIVTERLIGAGYCVTTTNRKGKMKLKLHGKSNWTAYKDNNISLTDPSLNFKYTNLVFSKDSDDLKNNNWGYLADGKFEYIVTIKDKDIKKGNIEVQYSDKGKPIMATLKKAGKYTISYKTIEGSNVGFTCKITVK
ncbi:MAG: S8 family serine peptidase, partial [Lachnospiraceae bacterium]|nr:S8 family serine peptidase [Lachnospiraceae bacterium]